MEAALNGPTGRTVLGSSELKIGRAPDNQLVINDTKTSGHHAEIRPAGNGYSIIDLGSTNGTFVNGQQLEHNIPRRLNPGDMIRIGDMNFVYETGGASAIPPTVYAAPGSGQGSEPSYQPTVAASPPLTEYGPAAQQEYQPPPPAYPGYPPPPQNPYGPPPAYAPPQMPYEAPPAAPPYPGYPVAAQPKRSRRGLWLTLGIVGGVLVLLCVLFGVFALAANASSPGKTLDTFCNALKSGDTHTAYTQFSASAQRRFPESQLNQVLAGNGEVTSCTHSSPNQSGDSATADLTIVYGSGRIENDTVALIKDSNGNWKIDNVQVR